MWYLIVGFFVLLLDQTSKYIIRKNFLTGEGIFLLPFVSITYVKNTGIAFGLFKNVNLVFIIVTTLIILLLIKLFQNYKNSRLLIKLGFILIISGALGNLIDRIFLGYVTDFIDFKIWPVFNIADSSITVGAILLFFFIPKK